jgi:hypothetical protein
MRCREYIDNVTPIVADLNKLIRFADAAYEESGVMLEDAKLDLEAKKDLYYSVTTGLSAVTSAMRAFKGDDELNQDAEKALALLKVRIGEKIGHIKSAIDVTSKIHGRPGAGRQGEIRASHRTHQRVRPGQGFSLHRLVDRDRRQRPAERRIGRPVQRPAERLSVD